MTMLTCPKCRHALPDTALDAGQCSLCGFPLDGPVVLGTPNPRTGSPRLLIVAGAAALVVAGTGYAFFGRSPATPPHAPEIAARTEPEPPANVVPTIAPLPHEPKRPDQTSANPTPPPTDPPAMGDQGQPPKPVAPDPPKPDAPRPIGVVMKVDPKIAPNRNFDHPDDTAAIPDLNSGDRVTLTGKVRALRIGSVNGKGVLDASGLVAEEIVITGDLNGEAQVLLHAPRGKVTVGGYVAGSTKLTVVAPGGEVMFATSGRVTGGSVVAITAKRLVANGPLSGGAKVNVTLTAPGLLKLKLAEEGATITYKKSAPADPAPVIEKGELRGGAKVVAGN